MVSLGDLSGDRNNNLNLIRMLAASGVLISHAYPIALGPGTIQPAQILTGHTLGEICVYIFFVISGFLITASFLNSRSLTAFLLARGLRLFPGLIVSLLIVALIMGPAVTSLPVGAYLTDPDTWTFLVRNTLLAFPQYVLPGVFTDNPYPTVEGSIWTLIHEVLCYVGVFLAGVAGLLARPRIAVPMIALYILLTLAIGAGDVVGASRVHAFLGLSQYFALGMLAYLLRDRIPLSGVPVVALIALAVVTRHTPFYDLSFLLALSYAVFWLGYVPDHGLRSYNRLGDYSYGVYIYAFPAQGLAVWLWGPMTPVENILLALPLTLIPSILSWHLIEAPALAMRKPLASLLTPRSRA